MIDKQLYNKNCEVVLEECSKVLRGIDSNEVEEYIRLINNANQVFFVGVGRVKLSLKSICKRYSHLGLKVTMVGSITEPAITNNDIIIVGSGSGETIYPLCIAKKAKEIGAKVIHIGSNSESSMNAYTDLFIRIPATSRAKSFDEIQSKQPMTSLFEQALLLFGDITAMILIENMGVELEDLWQYHANLE